MDEALRRRLDAVVAVAALLLSFGRAAIAPSLVIAFTGVLVAIFVDAELY